MLRKRVLLLSPPSGKRAMVIKDQYCSNTSKAGYYWIPVDLLVLSGDLAKFFELKVIDGIVEKKSFQEIREEVIDYKPDHIVILSSILTHHSDRSFIKSLREVLSFKTTFIGDVFYFSPRRMIEYEEVDSIIYEYPCSQLANFITDETSATSNIIFKKDGKVVELPIVKNTEVEYATPRHDLFKMNKYTVPLMVENLCTSVLTNFGCRFSCNYCPGSSVKYRERSVSDIIEELNVIKSQGITNFWIRDFTFGLNKERTCELLGAMISLKMKWFCLSRAEVLDINLIRQMRSAGCYLVMLGVDTINEKAMKRVKRQQNSDDLKLKIKEINESGILILSHMIIGLPEDSLRDMLRTLHFISFSKASFLSINLFSPRTGSKYFDDKNIKEADLNNLDSYYGEQKNYKQRLLYIMIKYYGMLHFYSNPVRLIRILRRITTIKQFKILISTGTRMLIPIKKS